MGEYTTKEYWTMRERLEATLEDTQARLESAKARMRRMEVGAVAGDEQAEGLRAERDQAQARLEKAERFIDKLQGEIVSVRMAHGEAVGRLAARLEKAEAALRYIGKVQPFATEAARIARAALAADQGNAE